MTEVTEDVWSKTTPFCIKNSQFSLCLQTHHKALPGMWLLCIIQFLVHPLSGCDSISYTHPVWRNGPRCKHHSRGSVKAASLFSLSSSYHSCAMWRWHGTSFKHSVQCHKLKELNPVCWDNFGVDFLGSCVKCRQVLVPFTCEKWWMIPLLPVHTVLAKDNFQSGILLIYL
jgi:hypothetical protein